MSDDLHIKPGDLSPVASAAQAEVGRAYDHNNDPTKREAKAKKERLLSDAREQKQKAERLRQEAAQLRDEAKEAAAADEDGAPGLLDEAKDKELKAEAAEEEAESLRAEAEDIPQELLSHDAAKRRTKRRMREDKEEWVQRLAVAFKKLKRETKEFEAWASNLPGWARGMRVLSGGLEPSVKIGPRKCETWDQIFDALERQGADLEAAGRAAREELARARGAAETAA